jgi:hypothetical protein
VNTRNSSTSKPRDVAARNPAPAAPGGRAGRGGGRPQKPIGQGSIDWVKTFRAAKTGGVQNYFIEMNEQLMRASVPYLKTLTV